MQLPHLRSPAARCALSLALLWSGLFGADALASDKGDGATLVVVLDAGDQQEFASQRTYDALVRELARRGFAATPLETDAMYERTTASRLDAARAAGDSSNIVLVETQARFFAQIAGRYRWTVTAEVTIAPSDEGEPLVRTVEVPVFLLYDHEREAEALAEASVMLARKVGSVARDYRDGER